MSSKSAVIKDILLVLDGFSPPPSAAGILRGSVDQGAGGGAVPEFDLGQARVDAAAQRLSLTGGAAHRLADNDASKFGTFLEFVEPGQYDFHLEVEAYDFEGQAIVRQSTPLSLSWVRVDDLGVMDLVLLGTENPVRAMRCQ